MKNSWFNLPSRVWTLEQNSGEGLDLTDLINRVEALESKVDTLESTVDDLQDQIDALSEEEDPEI